MPDIFVAKEKQEEFKRVEKPAPPQPPRTETVADQLETKSISNPLASFVVRPKKVFFDTQEKEEKIIFFVRRHPITNLRWILITLVMLFLPPIIFKFFPEFPLFIRYRLFTILIWYLLTFSFTFEQFLKWFYNVCIVTDERVVDIDFPSILYRDISSTKIEMIQDISVKMGGFIRSLFNFGDVCIQTAGEKREFVFEAISCPEEVIKIINQLILEEEKEKLEGRVR